MVCNQCSSQFEYFPGEKEAYAKFDMPLPENCQQCRQLRREAFRNERKLYYNKSFISGKKLIAIYPTSTPFKIIDQDEWRDDSFDATQYGRDFDFNRPFFEQLKEFQREVPRWCRMFLNCENSDFVNNCAEVKNSYLAFSSHNCENIYYCVRVNRSKDCIDCYNVAACEYCSNCVDCEKCYNTHFSQLTENSYDSYFLYDCRGCRDCILCAGLRKAQYMILNKQYSRDEYEQNKEQFLENLGENLGKYKEQLSQIKKQIPHRNLQIIKSENCFGDFIVNSKNIVNGFNTTNSEDCINAYNCDRLKNCYDNFCNDKAELTLECDTNFDAYNSKFSTYFVGSKNVQYLDQCFHLDNCFGCVGLKRHKNMILNKKYSKEDYEKMLKKITEHMKKTGEYGKPFPSTLTSFAFNDTVAQEENPLTEEEALSKGYIWHKEKEATSESKPVKKHEIPYEIDKIDESICQEVLTCEVTGKNYKIIPQELKFYKKNKLPIPRICPDERCKELAKLQNPKKFTDTACSSCNKKIKTTYPADSGYKILCEGCYLKIVY